MRVGEMFPKRYAAGEDLQGRALTLTIQTVRKERMRPGSGQPEIEKYVVYFVDARKGVVLSRTLAQQIAAAVGSDDTDDWPGKKITIFPEPMSVAGRNVVAIRARPADDQ